MSNKTSGIYIHFPFCSIKCGFCDFYSGPLPYNGKYFEMVAKEISLYKEQNLLQNYVFDTLYLGGGTPSLAKITDIEYLFDFFSKNQLDSNLKEITIEMNPEDVTEDLLKVYKTLGINRISLGIQSLDADVLKILGRRSTTTQNLKAIELVKKYFSNFSIDLMYSIPNQDLCTELFSYSSMDAPHVSAYSLTLYPGTPFYLNKEKYTQPEEAFLESYESIHNFFEQLGYLHYEVSNFCKPSYESLHNKHYWDQDFYLGLGVGASGYLKNKRYFNAFFAGYTQHIQNNRIPSIEEENINQDSFFIDTFILKIRTNKPFKLNYPENLSEKTSLFLDNYFGELHQKGYIHYSGEDKILTPSWKTWLISDDITKKIYNMLY